MVLIDRALKPRQQEDKAADFNTVYAKAALSKKDGVGIKFGELQQA